MLKIIKNKKIVFDYIRLLHHSTGVIVLIPNFDTGKTGSIPTLTRFDVT